MKSGHHLSPFFPLSKLPSGQEFYGSLVSLKPIIMELYECLLEIQVPYLTILSFTSTYTSENSQEECCKVMTNP